MEFAARRPSDVAAAGAAVATSVEGKGWTIDVVTDPAALEADWKQLEESGLCTPYQRLVWDRAWYGNVTKVAGETPVIVVLRSVEDARVRCILPLVSVVTGPLRVARFAGRDHSNINMPVMDRAFAGEIQALGVSDLMRSIGQRIGVDVIELCRMPVTWEGVDNPFATLPAWRSEALACLNLEQHAEGDAPPPKLSKSTRRKFQQKQKWLEEMGPTAYTHVTDSAEAESVLAAFRQQKEARFAAQRIDDPFSKPGVLDFLRDLATSELPTGRPGMDLFTLSCAGRPVAVFGGCRTATRLSGSIISFDSDGGYGRCSPGELLALHVIKDAWNNRLAVFDLGAGNDSYKSRFCGSSEVLLSVACPITLRGWAYCLARVAFLRGKARAAQFRDLLVTSTSGFKKLNDA